MVAVLTAGRTALTTGSSGWLDGVVYDGARCLSLLSSRGPPLAGRHRGRCRLHAHSHKGEKGQGLHGLASHGDRHGPACRRDECGHRSGPQSGKPGLCGPGARRAAGSSQAAQSAPSLLSSQPVLDLWSIPSQNRPGSGRLSAWAVRGIHPPAAVRLLILPRLPVSTSPSTDPESPIP
jgi:hypothetical protein